MCCVLFKKRKLKDLKNLKSKMYVNKWGRSLEVIHKSVEREREAT